MEILKLLGIIILILLGLFLIGAIFPFLGYVITMIMFIFIIYCIVVFVIWLIGLGLSLLPSFGAIQIINLIRLL